MVEADGAERYISNGAVITRAEAVRLAAAGERGGERVGCLVAV